MMYSKNMEPWLVGKIKQNKGVAGSGDGRHAGEWKC